MTACHPEQQRGQSRDERRSAKQPRDSARLPEGHGGTIYPHPYIATVVPLRGKAPHFIATAPIR